MATTPNPSLLTGASKLGIPLSNSTATTMLAYLALLNRWNKTYNLTSITGLEQSITMHLLDSLSIHPYLRGTRIADIGTGAGLPGIPLAIAMPERRFTLVDSRSKKTRFIRHACRELALENVEVIDARIEDYRPDTGFDTVTARALASLSRLLELGGHLLAPDGIMLAMKGRHPGAEAEEITSPWQLHAIHELRVPRLPAQRHLAIIGSEQKEH